MGIIDKLTPDALKIQKDPDYHLDKILEDYGDIAQAIKEKPQLRYNLASTYRQLYEKNKGVIEGASFIDKADRILGPIEAALRWFGPGTGYLASAGLRMLEWVAKIPYSIYYGAKTGDWGALPGWALSETMATILPYGDIIDVLPIYHNRATNYLRGAVAEEFRKQYLSRDQQEIDSEINQQRNTGRMMNLEGLVDSDRKAA